MPLIRDPLQITILAVPGCPSAAVLARRILQAMDGRQAIVQWTEVVSEEQAVEFGMAGSPTVLIDGAPLLHSDATPSMSCRLYTGPDYSRGGLPSVEVLRRALLATTPGPGSRPAPRTERVVVPAGTRPASRRGTGSRSTA